MQNHFVKIVAPVAAGILLAATALAAKASHVPENVEICHKPNTPEQITLTLRVPMIFPHIAHGDWLATCNPSPPCSAPPPLPIADAGSAPRDDEQEPISEAIPSLEGASPTNFNATGAPITFVLSCPTLQINPDSVIVYDNGNPIPFDELTLTQNSISITNGVSDGRHDLILLARDIYGYTIRDEQVLWAGAETTRVVVLDESGSPIVGATVEANLSDDQHVTGKLITDVNGSVIFTNLPDRSFNVIATASENRIDILPTNAIGDTIILTPRGIGNPSKIDNNDFSLGDAAGWEIGTAPVSIIPHVESYPGGTSGTISPLDGTVVRPPAPRTPERSRQYAPRDFPNTSRAQTNGSDFDLALTTFGKGQQSISRAFKVEDGIKSITIRSRFITSEIPGGFFGTKFNDFFNISIRSSGTGEKIIRANSMNGLGLAAFDSNGATQWFETEIPVKKGGDIIRIDVAVSNVADDLFDSKIIVDAVKNKKLTIAALQLRDIDNSELKFLSGSSHPYFSGNTRINGTITVNASQDDSLQELWIDVLRGQATVTGNLVPGLAQTLYHRFGADEEIRVNIPRLMFEVPASQLSQVSQNSNERLTLRVRARTSSGETAEKDFGPVTKLIRFAGSKRYSSRDVAMGGDDWALPGVAVLTNGADITWGDFSNMNGGIFPPHTTHKNGSSADGWFPGYNARDAATAATIVGHLNKYGRKIVIVYVTFDPDSAFAKAIQNVALADGRMARDVVRSVGGHKTHFHWEVTDN
jgi:hypothetical protein